MESPDRAALLAHLTASGIAGRVATPRENNLLHYRLLADRDPYYLLGLDPSRDWTSESVLELMAEKVGVSPDPAHRVGSDTIDPELTVAALERYADRLAAAALRRETVYFASGHPRQLADLYQRFADALREHGCAILRAGEGWGYDATTRYGTKHLTIGYSASFGPDGTGDVAALEDAGGPVHSHAARPIRATFAALAAAGTPLPDLVVADHGWCGGAGQAGVDAIGFADCNDPALFVGEYEGVVQVSVPLDDGLAPDAYAPLGDYVLARIAATCTVPES
ncbi:MAG TPA: phosphatase [Actinospica sp.]|nr:phosphatase [Actinospica sp.]